MDMLKANIHDLIVFAIGIAVGCFWMRIFLVCKPPKRPARDWHCCADCKNSEEDKFGTLCCRAYRALVTGEALACKQVRHGSACEKYEERQENEF